MSVSIDDVFVNMKDNSKELNELLNQYERVMVLKIYVNGDDELKEKYLKAAEEHNKKIMKNIQHIDAGFDIFTPREGDPIEEYNYGDKRRYFGEGWGRKTHANLIDFKIVCAAQMFYNMNENQINMYNTGYYMYPRSSISKTKLRLANNTGIIDAGYRGNLMGMFDVVGENVTKEPRICDYEGNVFDRYVQICSPGLAPILVEVMDTLEELGSKTSRGTGGFGSTGV